MNINKTTIHINLCSFIGTNIYNVEYIIMNPKYIDNNKTIIIRNLITINCTHIELLARNK